MRKFALSIGMSLGLAGQVVAADLYSEHATPRAIDAAEFTARWEASAYIYGWALSLEGDADLIGRGPFHLDVSFEEFLKHLDGAFMAFGEVRRDRIGIVADVVYAGVFDRLTPTDFDIEVTAKNDVAVGTLLAEYRVWERQNVSVDVMAGARIWSVSLEVELSDANREREILNGDETWVDPMVGVKTHLQGDGPFYLKGWAMIGGFGASAELDWDVFGGVGYELGDHFSFLAGYRAIGVDYETDDFLFDVIQHGPIIGGVLKY